MDRLSIQEVIVVEGRYDRNTLSQIVDAVVFETSGFGIFRDSDKIALLQRLARTRGLIIFTDSDGAGFVIRNRIKSMIPKEYLKHAYIPDVYGCEKRKRHPGKEGKLGVEGMTREVILDSLRLAGATMRSIPEDSEPITKQDFYELGLSGTQNSEARRKLLKNHLNLPELMNTNALLQTINILYDRKEFLNFVRTLEESND